MDEIKANAEIQETVTEEIGTDTTNGQISELVTKTVTETKYVTKFFSPYVGLSYLKNPWDEVVNPMIQLNGGFFIKEKYALNLIYQRGLVLKNDYIGGGILCKF